MQSSNAVATRNGNGHSGAELMESVVIKGDLASLSVEQRGQYYMAVCKSVGLNPLTQPFAYITLNGKLTLYALRNCTDQLRSIHKISVVDMTETERDGVCIVTCKVANADGRTDISKGAVNIAKLQGEALANAVMKAETKAKRRATLSICGLGLLDETEVEDIPAHVKTLPKKDARDIYTKIQAEIDGFAGGYDEFKAWMDGARERVAVLPTDWQDIIRARASEKLVELRQLGPKPAAQQAVADTAPTDPAKFLKWADVILGDVTDPGMLEPTYDYRLEPHLSNFAKEVGEEALGLLRKHEARLG